MSTTRTDQVRSRLRDWRIRCVELAWPLLVIIWVGLVGFALFTNAEFPDEPEFRLSMSALAVVASFLILIALQMLVAMPATNTVTISLAIAFGSCSVMPLYIMAVQLWPEFFRQYRPKPVIITSTFLILSCLQAVYIMRRERVYGRKRYDMTEAEYDHSQTPADDSGQIRPVER